jgi:hypothetical protein
VRYSAFILFSVLFIASCSTTKNRNEKYIYGKMTWEAWQKEALWSDYKAEEYAPNDFLVGQIKEVRSTKKCKFILFAGNWCGDSKTEVPKIFKLFELTGISSSDYELWGVDRDKREPSGFADSLDIDKVPTLIIIANGRELGRIVEFPKTTWEEDLLQILIKD